jgi:hypothetical protein
VGVKARQAVNRAEPARLFPFINITGHGAWLSSQSSCLFCPIALSASNFLRH